MIVIKILGIYFCICLIITAYVVLNQIIKIKRRKNGLKPKKS